MHVTLTFACNNVEAIYVVNTILNTKKSLLALSDSAFSSSLGGAWLSEGDEQSWLKEEKKRKKHVVVEENVIGRRKNSAPQFGRSFDDIMLEEHSIWDFVLHLSNQMLPQFQTTRCLGFLDM